MKPDDYRKAVAAAMGERGPGGLQEKVTELATALGWLVFHDRDSRMNAAGFPDLVMTRDGYLVLAELKSSTGRVRPDQVEWLERLDVVASRAPNVIVVVWRPIDLVSGNIEKVLTQHLAT